MTALLRVGPQRLWFPGQVKPNGIPRIDWTHPLANGLLFYAFDTGLGPPIDLAGGNIGVSQGSGSAPTTGVTANGTGLQYNAGTSYVYTLASLGSQVPTSGTLACAFNTVAAPTGGAGICNLSTSSGSEGYFDFEWNSVGGGGVQSYAAAGGNTFVGATGASGALNTYISMVETEVANTAIQYLNGAQSASASATLPSPLINSASQVAIGDYVGAGFPYKGFIPYVGVWSRALSAAEVLQLHQDPYCFLLPASVFPALKLPPIFLTASGKTQAGTALAAPKAQYSFVSAVNPAAGGSTNSGSASTATSGTTISIGSFVLVALDLVGTNSITTSVTDSAGNSYSIIAPPASTGTDGCAFAYCASTTNTITIGTTWTSSNSNSQTWFLKGVWLLSGVNAVDQSATINVTSAASTFSVSTATLSSLNTFCWGYIYPQFANSITSNSPWVDQYNNQFNAISEFTQTGSTSAVTYSGLIPAATSYSAIVVAFRPGVPLALTGVSQASSKMVAAATGKVPLAGSVLRTQSNSILGTLLTVISNVVSRPVFWIPRPAEVQSWQGLPKGGPTTLFTNYNVHLSAFAAAVSRGLGAVSGALPVFASGQSTTELAATSPSAALSLSARVTSLTNTSALETVIRSLSAIGRASSSIAGAPSYALAAAARLVVRNTAQISPPTGTLPLSARTSGSSRIIPASKPIANIFGLSRVSSSISNSLSLNAIVLTAKSAVHTAARSSMAGVTSLLSKASSQSKSSNTLSGSVVLLSATTVSRSTGRGAATGKGALNALMASISNGLPSISGRVSISALSAIRSAQRGAVKYIANLAAALKFAANGAGAISSFVNIAALLSNGSSQLKSRTQASFALLLSAKTPFISTGRKASSVALQLAGRAAFSSIARSVAQGTLPLFAHGASQLKTAAKSTVPFLLTARATIASHSLVSATRKLSLTGSSKIVAAGTSMFNFAGSRIPLLAIAAIKVRAMFAQRQIPESIEGKPVCSSEPGQIGPSQAQN